MSTNTPPGGSPLRRDLTLAGWQVVYEQRAFWRNRARAFFSFLMPIMFLVIFATIYHGQTIAGPHGAISYDAFFVPGILAYGIIATTFVNMALSTSFKAACVARVSPPRISEPLSMDRLSTM